jgi:Zn-finger nucleic acid-binding protein
MTDRQGVEIDYCPQCRGIWLDRGELEKIIERSADFSPGPTPGYPPQGYHEKHHDHDKHYNQGQYGYRKKKGFLGDLFDF